MSWAAKIRSSDFRAIADDAAKDGGNVAFLAALPLEQQAEWITRLRWLRLADRLSENQIVEPELARFDTFRLEWRRFVVCGDTAGEHGETWQEIGASLYAPSGEPREPRAVAAWDDYLDALREYTGHDLELLTLQDHDRMLRRLTGNAFEVFPYLRDSEREAAARFGALDQMVNNLRDIAEDARHGLCFFPREVLDSFCVTRASILQGSAIGTRAYRAMMQFWLDGHLPLVRSGAEAFARASDLHPSVARMRDTCLKRYASIERVLRDCDLNYRAFPHAYWGSHAEPESPPSSRSAA